MKPLAVAAAALLALQGQPAPLPPPTVIPAPMRAPPQLSRAPAQQPEPSGQMIDRFVAGLPKKA